LFFASTDIPEDKFRTSEKGTHNRTMAKRAANNYLTDQNWDEEEEPAEVKLSSSLYIPKIT